MLIRDAMLPEFDMEMANTRTALERAPEDQYGFKPHPKSWAMAELLTHLATLPQWGAMTLQSESFDVMPEGRPHEQAPAAKNRAEVLARFDENVAAMRSALAAADNDAMMTKWTLLGNGKEMFSMPRVAVLRGMILNHAVHHRGQLTVYLRLTGAPVPALYGPSGDEGNPPR
jgi:uncharacterized damage-inducible protein DinB